MTGRINISKRIRGLLAAGLWAFSLTVCPLYGEAALPTHPLPSSSSAGENSSAENGESGIRIRINRLKKAESSAFGLGENSADRIRSKVKEEKSSGTDVPENRSPKNEAAPEKSKSRELPGTVQSSAVPTGTDVEMAVAPANASGYTDAEIRQQMVRRYASPRPEFRRVSGTAAGADYRPGTMDVKIPNLFFPPDVMQDVSEIFLENPDGTFGTRAPEDMGKGFASYSSEAQKQLAEQAGRKSSTVSGPVRNKPAAHTGIAAARPKYKTITVQVPLPAPSPFRMLTKGDFYWFSNHKGHYVTALPGSLSRDPLLQVPATGPMLIRDAGQHEFMAVTVDDPADTYYYKNQDTFPGYGKAVPVFTETRKNVQGDDVSIKYIRRYLEGQPCLIVDSAAKRAGKTYRVAVVFPESKQHEYLPKALYVIENLKGN